MISQTTRFMGGETDCYGFQHDFPRQVAAHVSRVSPALDRSRFKGAAACLDDLSH